MTGKPVRFDQTNAHAGTTYAFYSDSASVGLNLTERLNEFANLLNLCIDDPQAAESLLEAAGIPASEVMEVVTRCGRDARRMHVDLRHESERRTLELKQRMESELIEFDGLRDAEQWINEMAQMTVSLPGQISEPSILPLPAPPALDPRATAIAEEIYLEGRNSTTTKRQLLRMADDYGGDQTLVLQNDIWILHDPGMDAQAQVISSGPFSLDFATRASTPHSAWAKHT